ncbi:MAG: hypothetical protein IPG90_07765 [Bacteroidetes bacterium]|nr:hypothetical protein [Bacteroidota bacterium]
MVETKIEMDVRIIGIAPLMYDRDGSGTIREGNIKKPLFWIYYPQAAMLKARLQPENEPRLRSMMYFRNECRLL